MSGLPPERWLRVRLGAVASERFADGRPLAVLDAGSGDAPLATLLAGAHPAWEVVAETARATAWRRGTTRSPRLHAAELVAKLEQAG